MATTEEFLAQLDNQMTSMDQQTGDALVLLYGDSGAGKTVAAQALAQRLTPRDEIILFIDSGKGSISLNNHPKLKVRTKRVQYKSIKQVEAFVTAIRNGMGDWGKVGAIVLDEASSMAKQDLDSIVRERAAVDASKDPNEAKWPDMGASNNRMMHLYNGLSALDGVHVISTAHVRMDKDDTGFERQSPDFMPQLSKQVRQLMHVVAYVALETVGEGDQEKEVRTFQCHLSKRIVAKTRVGGMGRKITYRPFADSLTSWLGNGGKSTEETPLVFDDSGSTQDPSERSDAA